MTKFYDLWTIFGDDEPFEMSNEAMTSLLKEHTPNVCPLLDKYGSPTDTPGNWESMFEDMLSFSKLRPGSHFCLRVRMSPKGPDAERYRFENGRGKTFLPITEPVFPEYNDVPWHDELPA